CGRGMTVGSERAAYPDTDRCPLLDRARRTIPRPRWQAVLGPGRLELLVGIDRLHSISAAARQMGVSYRHAWQMGQRLNEAAGEPGICPPSRCLNGFPLARR